MYKCDIYCGVLNGKNKNVCERIKSYAICMFFVNNL